MNSFLIGVCSFWLGSVTMLIFIDLMLTLTGK